AEDFSNLSQTPTSLPSSPILPSPIPTLTLTPTPILSDSVTIDAPFVSQAPFGQWSDPRFQDACEETSVLIAYSWAMNQPLTPQSATDEVIAMADFQTQEFGSFVDTSAKD